MTRKSVLFFEKKTYRSPSEKEKTMPKGIRLFYMTILCFSTLILIFLMDKGLEITDESFYLLKITYPFEDVSKATMFGELYSLLFFRSGGILAIRGLGFILLNIAALFFLSRINRFFVIDKFILYSVGLFSLQTCYWGFLLITPSYNLLAVSSCLVTSGAMIHLLFEEKKDGSSTWVMLLLAVGLAVLYFAKATSAAFFAIFFVLFSLLFLKGKNSFKTIFFVGFSSFILTLIAIVAMFGSPMKYLSAVETSLQISSALGGGYDGLSLIRSLYRDLLVILSPNYFSVRNVFIFPLLILFFKWRGKIESQAEKVVVLNLLYQLTLLVFAKDKISYVEIIYYQFGILLFFLITTGKVEDKKNYLLLAGVSFGTFVASRFGTGNLLFLHGEGSTIFLWGAMIAIIAHVFKNEKLKHFYITCLVAVTLIFATRSILSPYRATSPMWEHRKVLQTKKFNFKLEPRTYVWANEMREQAYANGFQAGNYLLDLTGGSPGALLFLDAKFLGIAWILGGYPGSNQYFKASLSHTACKDFAKAWLLITADGERRIDLTSLHFFGLDVEHDYSCFGDFLFDGHRKETQKLCRPRSELEKKMSNCLR